MSTSQLETERLLDAALQMSRAELERFVARLFALKARQEAPSLTPGESELLMKINQGVPVEVQRRYDSLMRKRRRHKLTRAEHRDLLALTREIECHDVERLKRLSDLARLRGLSLPDLMRALGIEAPEPDYA
ncbi:MAG: STAS/SEC14 domain-containing protein [Acidobacteriota bacterium]